MDIIEAIFLAAIGTLVGFFIGMSDGKCKKKSINNVNFYVARDKDGAIWLYLGKPYREVSRFHECNQGCVIVRHEYFYHFGLYINDYDNLRFEDEPVEVFLNFKD